MDLVNQDQFRAFASEHKSVTIENVMVEIAVTIQALACQGFGTANLGSPKFFSSFC